MDKPNPEILDNGRAVWVYKDGHQVAKFSQLGIEIVIHPDPNERGDLDTMEGGFTRETYDRFVKAVGDLFDIEIEEDSLPRRFRS